MRRIIAIALIAASALLAPVAVTAHWARGHLLDTDHFVEMFAPLASEPEMQHLLTERATDAITSTLPIARLIGEVFSGAATLPLPERAGDALLQLEPLAVIGMNSLIRDQVESLVTSEQFAQVWGTTLRESHARTLRVLDDDPDSMLDLADDGVLSLRVGPIVAGVQERLLAEGIGLARLIPETNATVELVSSDYLVMARPAYRIADAAGAWLPFVVMALAAAGVALARDRWRALAWTGVALGGAFTILGALLAAASQTAAESGASPATALLVGQITGLISAPVAWLAFTCVLVGGVGVQLSRTAGARIAERSNTPVN